MEPWLGELTLTSREENPCFILALAVVVTFQFGSRAHGVADSMLYNGPALEGQL